MGNFRHAALDFLGCQEAQLVHGVKWKGFQNSEPTTMAVPKKKTSNSKRDKRKATWKRKAALQAQKALSLGKAILSGRSTFVYPSDEEEEEES